MIKLRERPDYYRMLLKIHFQGDSEIFNYEYERENDNSPEDEFTSAESDDTSDKDEFDDELVLTRHSSAPVTQAEDEEELLDERLQRLDRTLAEKVKQVIKTIRES